jgi:predicted esterase
LIIVTTMQRTPKKSVSEQGHHARRSTISKEVQLSTKKPLSLWKKIAISVVAAVGIATLLAGISLMVFWVGYQPTQEVKTLVQDNSKTIVDHADYISILGTTNTLPNKILIFYPGAGVTPKAYTKMLNQLSGVYRHILIVKFPGNLAVLQPAKGDTILKSFLQDFNLSEDYLKQSQITLMGHSLGGAMLSEYYITTQYKQQITGVIFAGAYPASDTLRRVNLAALFISGEIDGLIDRNKLKAAADAWSSAEQYLVADMNHGQWGDYGNQQGDNLPKISYTLAQGRAAQKIKEWSEVQR